MHDPYQDPNLPPGYREELDEIQEDTTSMEEKLTAIEKEKCYRCIHEGCAPNNQCMCSCHTEFCGCQYEGEAKCCHEDCDKKHKII